MQKRTNLVLVLVRGTQTDLGREEVKISQNWSKCLRRLVTNGYQRLPTVTKWLPQLTRSGRVRIFDFRFSIFDWRRGIPETDSDEVEMEDFNRRGTETADTTRDCPLDRKTGERI